MTKGELLKLHGEMSSKALVLMEKKNSDYAHGSDPFKNFRRHGPFGILVRLSDKLARLETFVERGSFEVQDESFEDTCVDAMNYVVLLRALVLEARLSGSQATGANHVSDQVGTCGE